MPHDSGDSADVYLDADVDASAALIEVENQKARIQAIERVRAPGTLWDIGSGPGYLVKAAQMMGWEAAGCELSQGCCEFGRKRSACQFIPHLLLDFPTPAAFNR